MTKEREVWPGMAESTWVATEAWVQEAARLLGLGHWKITLKRTPLEDERQAQAMTSVCFHNKAAHIELHPDWPTYDVDEQRQILVHELLHPVTSGLRFIGETTELGQLLGAPMATMFEGVVKREIETMVEGLAKAIAESFPPVPLA